MAEDLSVRGVSVGCVGFGEAGFHLARGLREAGAPPLVAFDINARAPGLGERIRHHAASTGVRLAETRQELADSVSVLFSVVSPAAAVAAAAEMRPHLSPRHLYADLNSVAPTTKRRVAEEIAGSGARFVEGAIMAPVPGLGHRVPILLNGPWAPAFMEAVAPYGMRLERMDKDIGAAAAVKMCRSLVVKGLEALLLECALVAREYDAADRVFDSLAESFPGMDWRKTTTYMIGRVLTHGTRRAREMEEVAETMRAAGVEPTMALAAARRQDWEATLGRMSHAPTTRPTTVDELLQALIDRSPAGSQP